MSLRPLFAGGDIRSVLLPDTPLVLLLLVLVIPDLRLTHHITGLNYISKALEPNPHIHHARPSLRQSRHRHWRGQWLRQSDIYKVRPRGRESAHRRAVRGERRGGSERAGLRVYPGGRYEAGGLREGPEKDGGYLWGC